MALRDDPLSSVPETVGSLAVALAHTQRLLEREPAMAIAQATEILKVAPGHPQARLLMATGQRLTGKLDAALTTLETLAREQPQSAAVQLEFGGVLGERGRGTESVAALRRAVALKPDLPDAWRLLADQLEELGDEHEAHAARMRFLTVASRDPGLMAAGAALFENRIPEAEALLRQHLKIHPTDIAALRMLGEVAARLRRYGDAEELLGHCLTLAPGFDAARHQYAVVLFRQTKVELALPEVERLLQKEPRNGGYRNLKAAILAHLGDYSASIEVFEEVLAEFPDGAQIWMSYGHALKTAGRLDDSIAAYRRSIELAPHLGEAYWSLANLKTFRFSATDLAAIRGKLAGAELRDEDRLHFEFALGKALEDAAEYETSFAHYQAGSEIRRKLLPYEANQTSAFVRRSKATYSRAFFDARAGWGATAPDPIFIVGMPRAGSTLLEQILASHPLVEGTMELPDIGRIARDLAGNRGDDGEARYPGLLASLDAAEFRTLGERYLEQTRVQRKSAAPHFIDKMPNNFLQIGLIQLILPNARIIDARRHPLGCCFSNFKQHFARGQGFSYSLDDVGRYYRDYVELMAHFDAVLPGRVHRVIYESLVDDTESQVRRLLDYCGLPFDESCLRFYENTRAVRTASSEQVRRPIYRDGVDHWRHYEPWLEPLKAALSPVLDCYPQVPDFAESAVST